MIGTPETALPHCSSGDASLHGLCLLLWHPDTLAFSRQVTTLIGYGSPNKAGSHDVHGAALGEPETEETRDNLGWKYPPFELPDSVKETMSRVEEVRH